jgi:hypothetical protein
MGIADVVEGATNFTISVWEWSPGSTYEVEARFWNAEANAAMFQGTCRTDSLDRCVMEAEAMLHSWHVAGLMGVVAYFESKPGIWRPER